MEVLGLILVVAVCVALAWLGLRMEPHYVSKDGKRFLCMGQKLNAKGEELGRWRETRVVIDHKGAIQADQKRFMRRTTTFWRIEGRTTGGSRRKATFLLKGHDDHGLPALLALRLPAKSRAVDSLIALMPASARAATSAPPPRTNANDAPAPARPADASAESA